MHRVYDALQRKAPQQALKILEQEWLLPPALLTNLITDYLPRHHTKAWQKLLQLVMTRSRCQEVQRSIGILISKGALWGLEVATKRLGNDHHVWHQVVYNAVGQQDYQLVELLEEQGHQIDAHLAPRACVLMPDLIPKMALQFPNLLDNVMRISRDASSTLDRIMDVQPEATIDHGVLCPYLLKSVHLKHDVALRLIRRCCVPLGNVLSCLTSLLRDIASNMNVSLNRCMVGQGPVAIRTLVECGATVSNYDLVDLLLADHPRALETSMVACIESMAFVGQSVLANMLATGLTSAVRAVSVYHCAEWPEFADMPPYEAALDLHARHQSVGAIRAVWKLYGPPQQPVGIGHLPKDIVLHKSKTEALTLLANHIYPWWRRTIHAKFDRPTRDFIVLWMWVHRRLKMTTKNNLILLPEEMWLLVASFFPTNAPPYNGA